MQDNLISNIGDYCRGFRLIELRKTLKQVAAAAGSNEKALSSFEHGRANNIRHLTCYVLACDSDEQEERFYDGLTDVMERHKRREVVQ